MVCCTMLTYPNMLMSPSGYSCSPPLLPITNFPRNFTWISLSKMMIRTTTNKAANNQTKNMEYRKTTLISTENECECLHLRSQNNQLSCHHRQKRIITPLRYSGCLHLWWLWIQNSTEKFRPWLCWCIKYICISSSFPPFSHPPVL